jgi:hypothetical protein
MKIKNALLYLTFAAISFVVASCNSEPKTESALPAPANAKQLQDFVKGKKLAVKKVGFYGMLTVNNVREVKWLDVAAEKESMMKESAEKEMALSIQFVNDTAIKVIKEGKTYDGTYAVSDKQNNEGEKEPTFKLNLTYVDPEFSFGGEASKVTYSYPVIGLDDKKIMLETPRTVNRQKLIALMSE